MRRNKRRYIAFILVFLLFCLSQITAQAAYNTVPTKKYPTLENVEMVVTPNPQDKTLANVELHLYFSNNVGCIDETQEGRYNMEGYNLKNLTKFHLSEKENKGDPSKEIAIRVTPHPNAAKHEDTSKYFYIFAENLSLKKDYVLKVDEDLYANMGNSLGIAYEVPFQIQKGTISFTPLGKLPQTDVTVALFFKESTVPNNTKNVELNPKITLTFSNNVSGGDVLTYNAGCVYLVKGTEYLKAEVTAGPDVQQLIVKPKEPLEYETEYRIVVVKELMARNGSTLSSPVNIYFTTRTKSGEIPVEKPKETKELPDDIYFNDVANFWAVKEINYLADLGIVKGLPDGSFGPNNRATRAEVTTMLVKAFQLKGDSEVVFSDISGHWAQEYIRLAASAGVVVGKEDGKFAPNNNVTRQELVAMLMRARGLSVTGTAVTFTDGDKIASWAKESVNLASANGIVKGDPSGAFRPQDNVTKAEACRMIVTLLELEKK